MNNRILKGGDGVGVVVCFLFGHVCVWWHIGRGGLVGLWVLVFCIGIGLVLGTDLAWCWCLVLWSFIFGLIQAWYWRRGRNDKKREGGGVNKIISETCWDNVYEEANKAGEHATIRTSRKWEQRTRWDISGKEWSETVSRTSPACLSHLKSWLTCVARVIDGVFQGLRRWLWHLFPVAWSVA